MLWRLPHRSFGERLQSLVSKDSLQLTITYSQTLAAAILMSHGFKMFVSNKRILPGQTEGLTFTPTKLGQYTEKVRAWQLSQQFLSYDQLESETQVEWG